MRVITLEEHFTTTKFQESLGPALNLITRNSKINERLLDLGEARIRAMDESGIDHQVLSFTGFGLYDMPAEVGHAMARDANIQISEAMKCFPHRFGGFATLPMQSPDIAAKELDFCINTLGFVGAMIDGMIGGKFLDHPRFHPIFEVATSLDVPIYLHPAPPPEAVRRAYMEDIPRPFDYLLSTAAWGWHVETGLHALRMMTAGIFDRFPSLKIILGHMGENLPFSIVRADSVLFRAGLKLNRAPLQVFQENFWLTTSGYFSLPPYRCAREILGMDRIMYSVDYPFSEPVQGVPFLTDLQKEASEAEMIAITHGNAEKLLKINPL